MFSSHALSYSSKLGQSLFISVLGWKCIQKVFHFSSFYYSYEVKAVSIIYFFELVEVISRSASQTLPHQSHLLHQRILYYTRDLKAKLSIVQPFIATFFCETLCLSWRSALLISILLCIIPALQYETKDKLGTFQEPASGSILQIMFHEKQWTWFYKDPFSVANMLINVILLNWVYRHKLQVKRRREKEERYKGREREQTNALERKMRDDPLPLVEKRSNMEDSVIFSVRNTLGL